MCLGAEVAVACCVTAACCIFAIAASCAAAASSNACPNEARTRSSRSSAWASTARSSLFALYCAVIVVRSSTSYNAFTLRYTASDLCTEPGAACACCTRGGSVTSTSRRTLAISRSTASRSSPCSFHFCSRSSSVEPTSSGIIPLSEVSAALKPPLALVPAAAACPEAFPAPTAPPAPSATINVNVVIPRIPFMLRPNSPSPPSL